MAEELHKPVNPSAEDHGQAAQRLDDEQRVKVVSPSMLVFRRFIRNRLAVTGLIFFIVMLLFSYVGGIFSPYSETQRFYKTTEMSEEFAGVTQSSTYRFIIAQGQDFPTASQAKAQLAIKNGETTFTAGNDTFTLEKISSEGYGISQMASVAKAETLGGMTTVTSANSGDLPDGLAEAFTQAIQDGAESFTLGATTYQVVRDRKTYYAKTELYIGVGTMKLIDFDTADSQNSTDFTIAALQAEDTATAAGQTVSFEAEGQAYTLEYNKTDDAALIYQAGQTAPYAVISNYIVNSVQSDVHIGIDLRQKIVEAVQQGTSQLTYDSHEYDISRENNRWTLTLQQDKTVFDAYAFPSRAHWLGTDGYGMDILTRLMYGGRVSIQISFMVVLISLILGITLGGLSGYFGGWVDFVIMRLVDIFYCLPTWPIMIIIGAVMDELKVDSATRMNFLMLLLGVLGWSGVARMVRGQILGLRDQEFMIATEATGLTVGRRIFKHLVPNVIPQLIVMATMSMGDTILTESTLSFLGLGVKYPFASWGNIINAVSTQYVMTNYVFVWLPAGLCILITVLGFNFIGDGLRDAFDPKMKR